MRLLNPQIARDLEQGKPLRIDIGSGPRPRPGFYALDQLELDGIDIVDDLNQPLDLLPDNCAEHIFSSHTLEHVEKLLPLLAEIHRIARPGGVIEIIVPHFSNPYYYSDPTHVRFFGLYTMAQGPRLLLRRPVVGETTALHRGGARGVREWRRIRAAVAPQDLQ